MIYNSLTVILIFFKIIHVRVCPWRTCNNKRQHVRRGQVKNQNLSGYLIRKYVLQYIQ